MSVAYGANQKVGHRSGDDSFESEGQWLDFKGIWRIRRNKKKGAAGITWRNRPAQVHAEGDSRFGREGHVTADGDELAWRSVVEPKGCIPTVRDLMEGEKRDDGIAGAHEYLSNKWPRRDRKCGNFSWSIYLFFFYIFIKSNPILHALSLFTFRNDCATMSMIKNKILIRKWR